MNPLDPSPSLLAKLGSIVVHLQEFWSPNGDPADKAAIDDLLDDPEVETWLAGMNNLVLLPLKR